MPDAWDQFPDAQPAQGADPWAQFPDAQPETAQPVQAQQRSWREILNPVPKLSDAEFSEYVRISGFRGTKDELQQQLLQDSRRERSPGMKALSASVDYVGDYLSGIKQAGSDVKQSFAEHPVKSALSVPAAIAEPLTSFVGNTVGDASAVVHSAIDKIPGSRYIGDFDPKKTFAQRRAEYAGGIGKYTDPQTRLGKNTTNAMGAVLKPVGDVISLPGKAAGGAAGLLGATPENQKSISDQTTAIVNAALLARSMRPSEKRTPQEPQEPIPTKAELKARSQKAYENAKNAGATVNESSFANAVNDLRTSLLDEGMNQKLTPDAVAALEHIAEHKGPLTIKQLETYRKVAKNAESKSFANPADARLAGKIVETIDSYMEGLGPKDIIAGDAKGAVSALNEARDLWSRYRKAGVLDELMQRAELRSSQFSGSGYENAVRTEFRQLAMNKKKMRGFSQAEQAAIKKVVNGGPVENTLRLLGKAAPTSIVSAGLGSGAGLAAGGPAGAVAVPAVGAVSRYAAQKMTLRNADIANALMRRGPNVPPPPGMTFPNINPLLLGSNVRRDYVTLLPDEPIPVPNSLSRPSKK